jgi:hypothetical protein
MVPTVSCTSYTDIKVLELGIDYGMLQFVKFWRAFFALQD